MAALGTLFPILRDNQMLEGGSVGSAWLPDRWGVLAHPGDRGLLSANGAFLGLISLGVIAGIALFFTFVPQLISPREAQDDRRRGRASDVADHASFDYIPAFVLLVIAANLGLDVVLGAFLAGVVLPRWAPGDVQPLRPSSTRWATGSLSRSSS